MNKIEEMLFSLKDNGYKDFSAALTPSVSDSLIIGVRVPELRKLAKSMQQEEAREFISQLPHKYYEENNLHAFLIEKITDTDECILEIDRFLPFVDNWATCDMMSPKVFKKNKEALYKAIKRWIASGETYAVRYGIVRLMSHFLDEDFKIEHMDLVASAQNEEYYINMAVAWYFATALAKQYNSAVEFIKESKLKVWTHNKAIQKARESRRITQSQKEYLNTLKRKPTD